MDITRRVFIKHSALTGLLLSGLPLYSNNLLRAFFDDDETICRNKFKLFVDASIATKSIGDAIVEIGKSFLGTEYIGGTLDKDTKNEKLVINLTGLDCVTFVENCLVFARCVIRGETEFKNYEKDLAWIRYRNGYIDGYASRLHYFCDWIYDNEDKGVVKNITSEIGGVPYKKTINFMSTHTKSYKQLSNKTELEGIKACEEAINSRDYYYIPTKSISKAYDLLKNGDIIATTTSIDGLDVTHTGYVYKSEGGTYFLHASSKSKEVIVSGEELQEYVASDSKKTGIMVARPLEI
ncbi:MAG TPA: N-acetylmuramoyl-L-alanine amidase-like domain-containing protein [Ignavibacteria bacterium]|nr:N-acetylmuramoyl-L-alanine amidase-like domain-containing protein [Ignavibacteria bacterium]